jgi:hypothetical protein
LKPEGGVAAQVEHVEQREKVARPMKIAHSERFIRSDDGVRSDLTPVLVSPINRVRLPLQHTPLAFGLSMHRVA